MRKLKKLLKSDAFSGAFLLTASTLLVKFFGLVYKVPLSYILSDEGMGYFNTAYSVYTFFYVVCTAGIPKAMTVMIAERTAKGSAREAEKICDAVFRAFFGIGLVFSLAFMISAPLLSSLIGSPKSSLAMLAIAPSVLFVCAGGVLRGYFNGKALLLPVALSETISGVGKLVFGLILAAFAHKSGYEPYVVSAYSIFGISLGALFSFAYLYIHKKRRDASVGLPRDKSVKLCLEEIGSVVKVALPITLTSALVSLLNVIDVGAVMRTMINSGFSELQANVIYGNYTTLAIPLFNAASTLLFPLSTVALPMLTKLNTVGTCDELSDYSNTVMRLAIFFSVPISFLFFFYSRDILNFIYEDSSAAMAAPLLALLAPSVILMAILTIVNTVIEGQKKFTVPLVSLTLGAFVKLIASVALVSNDAFNIVAAPIGTLFSYIVSLTVSYAYVCHNGKIKLDIWKPTLASSSISAIAMAASLYLKRILNNIGNDYLMTSLTLLCFAALFAFLGFFYFVFCKKTLKISAKSTKTA